MALADTTCRQPLFSALLEALQPLHSRLYEALGAAVAEVVCGAVGERVPATVQTCGALPAVRTGRGRSLLTGAAQLARGAVVLCEPPLALVRLTGQQGLGPGGLWPETALALRLWRSAPATKAIAASLQEHGGGDVALRLHRAVTAVVCAVVASPGVADVAAVDELFSWLGRVRVNAVAVTAVAELDGDAVETSKVALALYPTLASCVNHDCQPNALLRFRDGHAVELVVSAPAGVASGEEVTVSYGPMAASLPRRRRRAVLLAQYGFECSCRACTSAVPEDFSWRVDAENLDADARAEAGRGNWVAAAAVSTKALAALRKGYAEGDVELAHEECKLAGLLLRAGDPGRAFALWHAAATVLRAVAPWSDPDLQEAEAMLGSSVPSASHPPQAPPPTRTVEGVDRPRHVAITAGSLSPHAAADAGTAAAAAASLPQRTEGPAAAAGAGFALDSLD
eukprot:NODE_5833_length_1730_cov_7.017467.p1 GENE.NODE_5833_length_1730_cov_7.017467~~NODE_5833_length_1730_cov_7.017467.p1  ORF type:complete len:511 (-),score=133.58 NODE_5833_length_1730_cov_7.017467:196-1557(-)